MNWDGYSNAGIRAGGIFALQPAPIQINHQVSLTVTSILSFELAIFAYSKEYIGTMGSDYIQYFISDNVSTPVEYRKYYTEMVQSRPSNFLPSRPITI
jgi:predicted O-linked N-acetylglucosamine transferase (SPINDLY family)